MQRGILMRWLFAIAVQPLFAVAVFSEAASQPRVLCYYTNWATYRPGAGKYQVQDVDPHLCTHLIYAYGSPTLEGQIVPFDSYQDIDLHGYTSFTSLKTANPKLKTLLSLGGTNQGSAVFSHITSDEGNRKTFIQNAIKYLRDYNFDGLDINWRTPASGDGSKPQDKANFVEFMKELRAAISSEGGTSPLLLSTIVPKQEELIANGFDVPGLMKYVDWMTVRTYDYYSSNSLAVNHPSPLYALDGSSDDAENVNHTVHYYIAAGADKSKLVLSIPTYGRSFTLTDLDKVTFGSPAVGQGDAGEFTRSKGFLAYNEICSNVFENNPSPENPESWTSVRPNPQSAGPYAYKNRQWVGYENADIVQKKAEYVLQHGLGGLMFWTLDFDDFHGTCHGKKYPLISAGKDILYGNEG